MEILDEEWVAWQMERKELQARIKELEKDNAQLIRELDNGLARKEKRIKELEDEAKEEGLRWARCDIEKYDRLIAIEQELGDRTAQLTIAREALEIYANRNNWGTGYGGSIFEPGEASVPGAFQEAWSWWDQPWRIATHALEHLTAPRDTPKKIIVSDKDCQPLSENTQGIE